MNGFEANEKERKRSMTIERLQVSECSEKEENCQKGNWKWFAASFSIKSIGGKREKMFQMDLIEMGGFGRFVMYPGWRRSGWKKWYYDFCFVCLSVSFVYELTSIRILFVILNSHWASSLQTSSNAPINLKACTAENLAFLRFIRNLWMIIWEKAGNLFA